MGYTLGQAAKATGMSKAALSRAIKNGRISAEKQDSGSYMIDPAELHRVYPPVAEKQANDGANDNDGATGATAVNTNLNADIRELSAKLEAATVRLADKEAVIADLREDRDRWRTQAEKLLLTDQRAKPIITPPPEKAAVGKPATVSPAPAKRRWRLFGGRG